MTDTFDSVLAEMLGESTLFLHEITDYHTRLAAAHAAEVAERDAMLREVEVTLENCAAHMTTLRARAEATERDARLIACALAGAYAALDMESPPATAPLIERYIATTEQAARREPVRDQDGNAICTCTYEALCPLHEERAGP